MQNLLHLSLSLIPNIFLIERKEFLVSIVMSSVMMMPFPDYFRINFILRLMCICSFMIMVMSTSDVVIYYSYFEILVNLQVFIFMKKIIFEKIYIFVNAKLFIFVPYLIIFLTAINVLFLVSKNNICTIGEQTFWVLTYSS